MSVLRIAAVGSVDDGKSTLIGRLLFDSKAVLADQLAAVKQASARRGVPLDLSLFTDGLRAEREQGITIDVAYRFFSTARRKFIIADCPGHLQYTRNMVTGASTADAAIVVVDASKGLQEQTRRHCFVASLLRVPSLVVCVNKMDLVGYDQEAFARLAKELAELARRLELADAAAIPVSALQGDNIVEASKRMPWYQGRCLLEQLETIETGAAAGDGALRLAVQCPVLPRPQSGRADYRGYTGFVASGAVAQDDEAVLLPSGVRVRVAGLELGGEPLAKAAAPLCVTLRLGQDHDVARGDMLGCPVRPPSVGSEFSAMVCWMAPKPLDPRSSYLVRQTTAEARAVVTSVDATLDIRSEAEQAPGGRVGLNDFARLRLKTSRPLCYDAYRENRATGSFILVDEADFSTVAAGMIL